MERQDGILPNLNLRAGLVCAGGVFAIIGIATGCTEGSSPQFPTEQYSLDRDNDGISNVFDRNPDIYDGPDVDFDGIQNAQENALYIYDSTNGGTSSGSKIPGNTTSSSSVILSCVPGYGPDYDKDGYPDHCDPVIGDKDSDSDGLLDRNDSAPHNPDRDNDGIPDGQDRFPDTNSKYEEDRAERERQEQQRQEQDRIEQQRERDRIERERIEDSYDNGF